LFAPAAPPVEPPSGMITSLVCVDDDLEEHASTIRQPIPTATLHPNLYAIRKPTYPARFATAMADGWLNQLG
jgi:hypothetical protein